MPRFRDGRMLYPRWHRRRGQMHEALFSGRRPRRWAHARFGTQTNPYGAAGGGTRQFHAGMSGAAGRVYAHMLGQARGGQGFNYGRLPSTRGYRGTRMAHSFRKEQSEIRKNYRSNRAKLRKELRKASGKDANQIRQRIRQKLQKIKGQHRVDRRQAAADWSKRNRGFGPRFGINVRQNPYTGRRLNTGFRFRRAKGFHSDKMKRARARNMLIANRMNTFAPMREGIPWMHGAFDMRLHGGQRKKGPRYGLPATHVKRNGYPTIRDID